MKKFFASPIARLIAFVLLFAATSSCHRGYGCPTNFSFEQTVGEVLQSMLSILF
ncbi:MAG: hypothetical protein ACKOAY_07290 [Haliscomenobacter sp.]